jgi:hypothetical protein
LLLVQALRWLLAFGHRLFPQSGQSTMRMFSGGVMLTGLQVWHQQRASEASPNWVFNRSAPGVASLVIGVPFEGSPG